ncbi:unnamed protein product [Amoebophrya sp. A25]|nr:unnamed protein product [Amoebophrya sp. A25]|eukprot:GSA25T00027687001.1
MSFFGSKKLFALALATTCFSMSEAMKTPCKQRRFWVLQPGLSATAAT